MGRVESEESDDVEEYDRDVDDLDETVNQVHLIGKKREVYVSSPHGRQVMDVVSQSCCSR